MRAFPAAAMALLTLAACGAAAQSPTSARSPLPSEPSPTTRYVDGCPVTVPPQPGFAPPEPYPAEPPTPNVPEADEKVWFGSAGLWTMLDADGEVWEGLPEHDGNLTEKSFWWSETYPSDEDPAPALVLSGRRLDRGGTVELGRTRGGGFREDIGHFLLAGLSIRSGCWELTASYRGAELSYVVLIKG